MKQHLLILILTLALVFSLSLGTLAVSTPFQDVPDSAWYAEPVSYVYEHRLMTGTSDSTFSPNCAVDRAMAVTILYRLNGSTAVTGDCPFQDVVSSQYCYDAVRWAVQNRITYGISSASFAPHQHLTREQLVTFLYRYAELVNADLSFTSECLDGYTDINSISDYALPPFAWAVHHGFVYGTSVIHLSPQNGATRAECAAILTRFHEWITGATSNISDPDEPAPEESLPFHEHTYIETEIVPPTCTEPGYTVYRCTCGSSYTCNVTGAKGHSYDSAQKYYTNEEKTEYECRFICSVCGDYTVSINAYSPPPEFKRAVEAACTYYINQFRTDLGSENCEILPGMGQVAAYRAIQLQTNFSHNEEDIREAHAYYKYGEYIDMTQFGYDESYSYWTCNGMEAITTCGAGPSSSADEIGKSMATNFFLSPAHWSYLGNNMFSYLAAGVDYGPTVGWTCCVMVNDKNYG